VVLLGQRRRRVRHRQARSGPARSVASRNPARRAEGSMELETAHPYGENDWGN